MLDVEGNEIDLGKKTRKDSSRGKQTLVSLYGQDRAKKYSEELITEAVDLLKPFGKKADRLKSLTNFIISRNNN